MSLSVISSISSPVASFYLLVDSVLEGSTPVGWHPLKKVEVVCVKLQVVPVPYLVRFR